MSDLPEYITDGFGNEWLKCGPDCDIKVVRPGKVECSCSDEHYCTQCGVIDGWGHHYYCPHARQEMANALAEIESVKDKPMTNNSINIAIAEACGWKHEFDGNYEDPEWYWIPPNDPDGDGEPPDYCNDLNAMHEAEKVLIKKHYDSYEHRLGMTVNRPWHATARQRAEAFLRTIGKWEDEQ